MDDQATIDALNRQIDELKAQLAKYSGQAVQFERCARQSAALVDSLKEGVILQAASGRILTWNASTEAIFGVSAADAIGRTSMDMDWQTIHPDGSKFEGRDHPSMVTLTTGRPCNNVVMGVRRTPDDIRWISINTRPIIENGQTTPSAVAISFSDCTERMAAEAELEREAVRRRILIEQSRDGIVVLDNNGRVFEINQKFADMLGYPYEEARTLCVWDWEHRYSKEAVLEMLEAVDAAGDHFETEHRRKDGTTYPVEISTNGAVFEGSKRVFCVCRDITERKRAEEALRESEERFRRLFEDVPIAIQGYQPDGTVMYWNKASEAVYGYSKADAIGSNLLDLIIPLEMRDTVKAAIRQGAATGEIPPPAELELRHKNGEPVPVLSSHVAIQRPGKQTELYCLDNDLSGIKQLQKELAQARKMEAIGTLTGGIAHDFNNILGIVLGNCELALDDVPQTGIAHGNLREIIEAVLRAKGIVSQLLTYCQHGSYERKPLRLVPTLEGIIDFIRSAIPSTIGINRAFRTMEDTVLSDPSLLHQVLLNLCANAARAMRAQGGGITIGLDAVGSGDAMLEGLPEGRYVALSVSDTGPGIDADIIDRVFDPYFTTAPVGEGSGMGLAVVQGIVNSHEGKIDVQSPPGKGATFTVLLPLCETAADAGTQRPAPAADGGSEHILLVDDEPAVVRMNQKILQRFGYVVHGETDPHTALSLVVDDPDRFDLVITDMTMPVMTGLVLAERIINMRPDLPVILCTGYSEQVSPERLVELGIDGCLMKPVAREELARMVRHILDGR